MPVEMPFMEDTNLDDADNVFDEETENEEGMRWL